MSYKRHIEDKRRLSKLYNDKYKHRRWIVSGVCCWNGRYVRVYRGRRSKYFKKVCNRKIRRRKDIGNYGSYKKATEFWWVIT